MNETIALNTCVFPFRPHPVSGECKSAAELFGLHWDVEIYTYTAYLAFLMAGFTRAFARNLRGDLRVLVHFQSSPRVWIPFLGSIGQILLLMHATNFEDMRYVRRTLGGLWVHGGLLRGDLGSRA